MRGIGQDMFAARPPGTDAPDLGKRLDALLLAPGLRLAVPADIEAMYKNAMRAAGRTTTRRWFVISAGLNLFGMLFDFSMVPGRALAMDVAFRLLISAGFLAGGLGFGRGHRAGFEPVIAIAPCLLMMLLAGTTGLYSGDAALLERFVTQSMVVILTATIFLWIDFKYSCWLAALGLAGMAGFIAASGIAPAAAKGEIIEFYAGAELALLWGRYTLNLYRYRLFLLNTRENMRNADARRRNEQLSGFAYTDKLTEIPNRRYFDEICAAMRETSATLLPLSLCMIDIDYFKNLNDALGHLRGDRCLRLVAGAIRHALRDGSDILARYGGEEFVVLLPATEEAVAVEIAERIRQAVLDLDHGNPGTPLGRISVSIGVAALTAAPVDIEVLIAAADAGLYRAKHGGRNRVSQPRCAA
jgi:diguanylate cyclase (GGDEF)-like protein